MHKTIVVLLDACRFDIASEYLGYLEHMIDYGQGAKYKIHGELPSLSRPMYATIFTGLPVYRHGISCNETVMTLPFDNVFSLCKVAGGVTAAVSWSWMSELYNRSPFVPERDRLQLGSGGSIDYGLYYWSDDYPDSHVFAEGENLRQTFEPDLILYHTMALDRWGHEKGGDSDEYKMAMAAVGHLIAGLMPKWLEEGWQVVVTGDHGMDASGIHAGSSEAQRDVPLYIFSDRLVKGRYEDEAVSQLNLAPVLCRLMDIPVSGAMLQKVQIKMTDEDEG